MRYQLRYIRMHLATGSWPLLGCGSKHYPQPPSDDKSPGGNGEAQVTAGLPGNLNYLSVIPAGRVQAVR